jgi:hypothetical protein
MRALAISILITLVVGAAYAAGETVPEGAAERAAEKSESLPEAGPVLVVARATFTTGISEREPVDSITSLTNDQAKVFFFSEIQGTPGQKISHRWEYNGEVMADVSFTTGGTRWRVYSSKRLFAGWVGDWTVVVVDALGTDLSRHRLAYIPADDSEPAQAPAAAPPAEGPSGLSPGPRTSKTA